MTESAESLYATKTRDDGHVLVSLMFCLKLTPREVEEARDENAT